MGNMILVNKVNGAYPLFYLIFRVNIIFYFLVDFQDEPAKYLSDFRKPDDSDSGNIQCITPHSDVWYV